MLWRACTFSQYRQTPEPLAKITVRLVSRESVLCKLSVTCLATDASLTADPGVASLIPARDHTFVEIDLLPSAESFKKGCCQLQAKVCARSTG